MKKKFALTLLEIMVVIFIIGIIGGVIAINMKGSLEKGKAFKSEKGSKQVYDILSLELAQDPTADISSHDAVTKLLENSGLPQDAKKLLVDGWGGQYRIEKVNKELKVTSDHYVTYLNKTKKKSIPKIRKEFTWMNPKDKNSS